MKEKFYRQITEWHVSSFFVFLSKLLVGNQRNSTNKLKSGPHENPWINSLSESKEIHYSKNHWLNSCLILFLRKLMTDEEILVMGVDN